MAPRAAGSRRSQGWAYTCAARASIPATRAVAAEPNGYVRPNSHGNRLRNSPSPGVASAPRTMSVSVHDR